MLSEKAWAAVQDQLPGQPHVSELACPPASLPALRKYALAAPVLLMAICTSQAAYLECCSTVR
jgi:hypothetical protein